MRHVVAILKGDESALLPDDQFAMRTTIDVMSLGVDEMRSVVAVVDKCKQSIMRSGTAISQLLLAGALLLNGAAAIQFRGVNLGGWLVAEPWMTPSLFNSTNSDCEWKLCSILGKTQCQKTLQQHWSSFITRDDFVRIQGAGLNAVRIPFGYWAVDLKDSEPYVNGQYPYLIQAVQWADQLGLHVFIDLHGVPGSQNGWEESGYVGSPLFLTNSSNSDRALNVLKNLTTEFSKSQYNGAVTNIELMNEPTYGFSDLLPFYKAGSDVVGAGNSSGINITISDGFFNPHTWNKYNPWDGSASVPAQHLTVDTHQFWAFPPLDQLDKKGVLDAICAFGVSQLKTPPSDGTPPSIVGEWSLSTGITAKSTSNSYDDTDKRTWFRTVFEAQNAAYSPNAAGQAAIGWFFWSWKTEYDIDAWSYSKGLDQKYIPSNISDPSTYAFPIKSDTGCIDYSHNYTAPQLPNQNAASSSNSSSSSGTATTTPIGSSVASSSPSSTKTNAASRHSMQSWLALVFVIMFGISL